MSWRYYAYRLNGDGTETLVNADLPLSNVRILRSLNAPPLIDAVVQPEIMALKGDDGRPVLDEWSTSVYAEQDGVVRAGGILTKVSFKNDVLELQIDGFMSYPDKQGWTDVPAPFYETDPALIYRFCWNALQAKPMGNLGLWVETITTPRRLGTRAKGDPNAGGTSDDPILFASYHTTDLGKDMMDVLSAGNIEVEEVHAWNGEKIDHKLYLAYPRRGRRIDLRFVIGENVLEVPNVEPKADMYASEVIVVGAGDGPAALVGTARSTRRDRLRRVVALSRQDLGNQALVGSYAAEQLKKREVIHDDVDEFEIRDTPYAPVSSVSPGDEITVTGFAGWAGTLEQSFRVISIEHHPDTSASATFRVVPTDKAY